MNSLPQPEGENLTGRPNAKPILWSMVLMIGVFFLVSLVDHTANNRQENPFILSDLLIAFAYGVSVGVVIQSRCATALKMLMTGLACLAAGSMMYMLCCHYNDLVNPNTLSCRFNFAISAAALPFYIVAVIFFCCAKPRGTRSLGTLLITAYMCLIMAFANQAQATGSAQFQGSGQLQSSGQTNIVAHPNMTAACIMIFLFLILLGLAAWGIWEICKAAHLCGNTGSTPPASPPGKGGDNDNVATGTGKVTSKDKSVNTAPISYPGLFNNNQQFVFADATNMVSIWYVTNSVTDPYIDTNYSYVVAVNYSLQATTNLCDWHTVCTVIQWQTSDPINPLFCQVLYTNQVTFNGTQTVTNGYPIGTNWFQVNLNMPAEWGGTPTNMMVYGSGVMCQAPVDTNKPTQYFRLYSNTNAVVTTGP